jgi:hypothetical protein
MSIESEFGFIGWCKEDNHDKIWGYFYRPTPAGQWHKNCCVFWARRGKAMQFKADVATFDLTEKLVNSKHKKGYERITPTRLFEIWPTFIEEAEAKLMWDVLAGKIK